MGSRYRYVGAVGQINEMACWAASMKWWYKAVLSITPSQTKLWDRYKGMRDSFGGMPDYAMEHIIGENAMVVFKYSNPASFDASEVKSLLRYGPLYVAYTESGTHKKHVNVMYEIDGETAWANVRVMEPQARLNSDGVSYSGKHESKSISDFNMLGTVYVGAYKKKVIEYAYS